QDKMLFTDQYRFLIFFLALEIKYTSCQFELHPFAPRTFSTLVHSPPSYISPLLYLAILLPTTLLSKTITTTPPPTRTPAPQPTTSYNTVLAFTKQKISSRLLI